MRRLCQQLLLNANDPAIVELLLRRARSIETRKFPSTAPSPGGDIILPGIGCFTTSDEAPGVSFFYPDRHKGLNGQYNGDTFTGHILKARYNALHGKIIEELMSQLPVIVRPPPNPKEWWSKP